MITVEEAYAAIDPELPAEQRQKYAEGLLASSAANDAYLNSRPQLEQIIARAEGAGKVPTHDELNGGAEPVVATGAGTPAAEAVAATDPTTALTAAPLPTDTPAAVATDSSGAPAAAIDGTAEDETNEEAELAALRERVSTLEAERSGRS